MKSEMESLRINQTWKLVPKPASCYVVDCKWLFKVKQESKSVRFKTRLVAKGFTQKEGIDYAEIFAPVVKFTTVRIILALVANFNRELKQMDVTTPFLHAAVRYSSGYGQLTERQRPSLLLGQVRRAAEGVKGYRLWNKSEPGFKVVISRDVVFNENEFPCLPLHVPIPENDAPNEVEQKPIINQPKSFPEEKLNDIIIENQDEIIPNEVEHDMQEIDNMHDLNDYQLTRDRNKRTIRKPERYRDCNLIDCNMSEFAFNVFESLECNEPKA
ncbi:uncharacterized protein LOC109838309 [Asparagus officinalis]|uniref:uncharacterized protein LOC109838309 n=1 Tax=Asparagus officinalis TaxID=4686 RepID=UPI00098E8634|nr:uncharacterized protein LOC109838309 [Asparagus officinalis]